MDLQKLANKINQVYGEPFLPKDFVRAQVIERESGETSISVQVGNRDVDFNEKGECLGSGTGVGCGAQWDITNRLPIRAPSKSKDLLDTLEDRGQVTIKRRKRLLIINCISVEAMKED